MDNLNYFQPEQFLPLHVLTTFETLACDAECIIKYDFTINSDEIFRVEKKGENKHTLSMSEQSPNVLTDQNTSPNENQHRKNRLISEVDMDKNKLTTSGDSLPYIDWKDVGTWNN